MFNIDKRNNIKLTKGDNAAIKVELTDAFGNERPIFADDEVKLTVRKHIADNEPVIEIVAQSDNIPILPSHTKDLATGMYIYDVQITTFDGKIYTIIPSSIFEITQEVTR